MFWVPKREFPKATRGVMGSFFFSSSSEHGSEHHVPGVGLLLYKMSDLEAEQSPELK